jgi:putative membrane-bound dehydrogenase-like protein
MAERTIRFVRFRVRAAGAVLALGWLVGCPAIPGSPGAAAPGAEPAAAEPHPALPPQEAMRSFQLPPGFQIELVAAEPDLVNPMTMAWDERGRLYVSLAHSYRYGTQGSPVDPPSNPVVRLDMDAAGQCRGHTVVMSGFENPVMGLAVREGQLWATNLNEVFVVALNEQGRAGDKRVLIRDAETPWNPFGMYRLMFGRDGLLYLAVGDHPTRLTGPTNQIAVRGNTGAVFRFRPDGSQIGLLAQGMRAPFSFDIDPFGRVWLLSNGEGNPNRLIHMVPGADYHFQTRAVSWDWLAGKHAWAPPVWENPPGAHTAVVAYDGAAFPAEYRGNLLVANWGAHGFPSANHVILRHVLDAQGRILRTEPFLTTTDPRFRPTQIAQAPDGNLYLLDWYGRDDENDLTGRLYKISYPSGGAGAGDGSARIDAPEILKLGAQAADRLTHAVIGADARAAADALWLLRRSEWPQAAAILERGLDHPDGRVRRLAVQLLAELDRRPQRFTALLGDPDPEVRLEAALACCGESGPATAVLDALYGEVAASPRLRYRAALLVARRGTADDFVRLILHPDPHVQLAGLIALDEAFHEGICADAAQDAIVRLLTGEADLTSAARRATTADLLQVAGNWPRPAWKDPVLARLGGAVTVTEFLRGVAVLQALGVKWSQDGLGWPMREFLRRVATEQVTIAAREDGLGLCQMLVQDELTPDARTILARLVRAADAAVRAEAHGVLAAVADGDPECTQVCRTLAGAAEQPLEQRLEALVTLSHIETQLDASVWSPWLVSSQREVTLTALRNLRNHADRTAARKLLDEFAPQLAQREETLRAELTFQQRVMASGAAARSLSAAAALDPADPERLRQTQSLRAWLLANRSQGDPRLGRLSLSGQVCRQCHLPDKHGVLPGPRLDGLAAVNTAEYLVDAILFPSRTIKTGFAMESLVTQRGQVIVGRPVRDGDHLVVTLQTAETVRIPMADVEERHPSQRSLMPDGLDTLMSQAELLDLIAYLTDTAAARP